MCIHVFFFNDTATTEIYTLSLHDALPISLPRATRRPTDRAGCQPLSTATTTRLGGHTATSSARSEEHTSELQSRQYLVCRLLLEKKKNSARPGITLAFRCRYARAQRVLPR